jgi:hypothetical protein
MTQLAINVFTHSPAALFAHHCSSRSDRTKRNYFFLLSASCSPFPFFCADACGGESLSQGVLNPRFGHGGFDGASLVSPLSPEPEKSQLRASTLFQDHRNQDNLPENQFAPSCPSFPLNTMTHPDDFSLHFRKNRRVHGVDSIHDKCLP